MDRQPMEGDKRRMKRLKTYKELTPEKAFKADRSKLVFKDRGDKNWIYPPTDSLAIDPKSDKPFIIYLPNAYNSKEQCAIVEERMPRDVPKGVEPLPEDKPWLAYAGRVAIPADGRIAIFHTGGDWSESYYQGTMHGRFHIAVDVRSDWAKKHFPELVEAMEWKENEGGNRFKYGYDASGDKIFAPFGYEIIPEGSKLNKNVLQFTDEWEEDEFGCYKKSLVSGYAHACDGVFCYAKPKQEENRVAKAGEVWIIPYEEIGVCGMSDNDFYIFTYFSGESVHLGGPPTTGRGCRFVAPSIREYFSQP